MSALDALLIEHNKFCEYLYCTVGNSASAELAALRDSLSAWSTLWAHICQRLNGDIETLPNESNFDAMLSALRTKSAEYDRIAELIDPYHAYDKSIYDQIVDLMHDDTTREYASAPQTAQPCKCLVNEKPQPPCKSNCWHFNPDDDAKCLNCNNTGRQKAEQEQAK